MISHVLYTPALRLTLQTLQLPYVSTSLSFHEQQQYLQGKTNLNYMTTELFEVKGLFTHSHNSHTLYHYLYHLMRLIPSPDDYEAHL